MDQVIKRLTKFQKTSELNESLELVRIDEIIENVIISFKPRLLDKKIIVNRNLEIKQINAYPTHIRELFVILIDNAIKFSKTYGEITINSAKVNNFIIFEVIDSGIGISKESIPFIFDRFYKSDTSRNKNNDSGTGLGLSIAKEIIEKHNGSIICNSEQDKSTKFTIKIPFK
jgi:signal transduction histidine kinase